MLMLDYKDTGWWYWLATCSCTGLAAMGNPTAYNLALLIGATHLVHYMFIEKSVLNFTVQLRIGVLFMTILALNEGFEWVLWVITTGLLVRVLTGYCIMARTLVLLPFNREEKLSIKFIKDAFFAPPVPGNIMHGLPAN